MKSVLCFALILFLVAWASFVTAKFAEATKSVDRRSKIIAVLVEKDVSKQVESELSRLNDTNSLMVLSSQSEHGLSELVQDLDKMTTNFSQSEIIFSFLHGGQQRIFTEIAGQQNVDFLGFDSLNCQMSLMHKNSIFKCRNYLKGYLKAIKAVIGYFQFQKVVMISSNDRCDKKFADDLYAEIDLYQKQTKDDVHEHLLLAKYVFNNKVINRKELNSILYETKVLDVSLVILICQSDVAEIVFDVATKYSMLSYNRVWMTVDYRELKPKVLPLQFINVAEQRLTYVAWKAKQVTDISTNAVKIVGDGEWGLMNATIHKDDRRLKQVFTNLSSMFTSQTCPSSEIHPVQVLYKPKTGNWVEIFIWKPKVGVVLSSKNTDLHKIFSPPAPEKIVTVVTILDEPFTAVAHQYYKTNAYKEYPCEKGVFCSVPVITGNQTIWNGTCCIGHSMELLQLLARDLYFTPKVYIVEDGYYGSPVNGKWVGMIGDVYNKKADIAMAGLTISNTRSAVVDYTAPFMRVELGIIISTKYQETKTLNFSFLSYISENLYWCLLGLCIIGILLLYCFENEQVICDRKCGKRRRRRESRTRYTYSWKEGFTYFSGLTFQRDLGGKNPTQYGARVTAVVFAFSMVITMTAYTAVLTASNVKQEERNPFLGLKDERMRNPTADFKFATVSATATETFFREAPDPTLHRLYLFMKNYNVKTTMEGINNVLNGKLQGFINENTFLKHYISKQRECILRIVGLSIDHISYGIAVQKGSAWQHPISNAILKYIDSGVILRLEKKWLSGVCSSPTNTTTQHESYSAKYFSGLFVIVLSATVFSFIILGCEHMYDRYYEKVTTPIETSIQKWKDVREKRKSEGGVVANGFQTTEEITEDSIDHIKTETTDFKT